MRSEKVEQLLDRGGAMVEEVPSERGQMPGFVVYYLARSAKNQKVTRKFKYKTSTAGRDKKNMITAPLLENLMKEKVLKEMTREAVYERKPYEMRSLLVRFVNKIFSSNKRGDLLRTFDVEKSREPAEDDETSAVTTTRESDGMFPSGSIFKCEEESANTKVFLAPSFSGKTTLMVDQLNKLTKKDLDEYDRIYLFTPSIAAAPLRSLNRQVTKKLRIYDRFIPELVKALKQINTITKNRYRFLLMMDDCLNLQGTVLIQMILTLRNANISTVISIQYSKLLAKSQRQSIHDYFIINLHLEDLEYLMSGFLASHFRELFIKEGESEEVVNKMNYKKLSEKAMARLEDRVLHFNQRKNEISIYRKLGGPPSTTHVAKEEKKSRRPA